MDDLLGVLIFIVVAAIGLFSKMREQKTGGDLDEESTPPPKPLDIPDVIRRRLIERREIRTARPAAPSRPTIEEDEEGWQTVEPPRPTMLPPRPMRRQEPPRPPQGAVPQQWPQQQPRPRQQVQPPRPPRPSRPVSSTTPPRKTQPVQRPVQQSRTAVPVAASDDEGPRMRPQDIKPISVPKPVNPMHQAQTGIQRVGRAAAQQALLQKAAPGAPQAVQAAAAQTRSAKGPLPSLALLLRDANEVRKGIVMSEVLGPPLAFR